LRIPRDGVESRSDAALTSNWRAGSATIRTSTGADESVVDMPPPHEERSGGHAHVRTTRAAPVPTNTIRSSGSGPSRPRCPPPERAHAGSPRSHPPRRRRPARQDRVKTV